MAVARRPEVLLVTDNKTVLLSLERDGKFPAKSAAWEENKVILPGEEKVIWAEGGRWFASKKLTRGRSNAKKSSLPATSCNVATGALRRNRCAATAVTVSPLRRNRLFPEADALVADEERDRVLPTLPVGRGRVGIAGQGDRAQVGLSDRDRHLLFAPAPAGAMRARPLSRSRRHRGPPVPIHYGR